MIYTPPEPLGYLVEHNVKSASFKWSFHTIEEGTNFYTDTALQIIPVSSVDRFRSEVERVRWETIEECAKVCDDYLPDPSLTPKHCAKAIRGLLK